SLLQVVTWPMGFIIVAKGRRVIFFWAELVCAAAYAALAWVCIPLFGLKGAGIAFFSYCVFHGIFHYPIVSRLSGFRWSKANLGTALLFSALIAAVFWAFKSLSFFAATSVGALATCFSLTYSIRLLCQLVTWKQLPQPIRRLISGVGLAPAGADA